MLTIEVGDATSTITSTSESAGLVTLISFDVAFVGTPTISHAPDVLLNDLLVSESYKLHLIVDHLTGTGKNLNPSPVTNLAYSPSLPKLAEKTSVNWLDLIGLTLK